MRLILEECKNMEALQFVREFINFLKDLKGILCVSANLEKLDLGPDLLKIVTWVECPSPELESEIYDAEYKTLEKYPHRSFNLDFSLKPTNCPSKTSN